VPCHTQSGRTLINAKGGYSFALGSTIAREGKHSWSFEITGVKDTCSGMFIGVMDAERSFMQVGDGSAWGYYPFTGTCKVDDAKVKSEGARITQSLASSARGCKVEVIVDMATRKLLFAVNGAKPVDAGLVLPQQVRPWVRLFGQGDAIRFVSAEVVVGA
tara:strand:+ start:465 stop:944 length:480 start_codon:yes stop_codon:yes gene_type:complete